MIDELRGRPYPRFVSSKNETHTDKHLRLSIGSS